jgi:hypothetical protein
MTTISNIQILDNYLPEDVLKKIQGELFTNTVPWNFEGNIAGNTVSGIPRTTASNYGFSLTTFVDGQVISPYNETLMPLYHYVSDRFKVAPKELWRVRTAMRTKSSDSPVEDGIHTDYTNPHLTLLFYVNTADGNTMFYNKLYKPDGSAVYEKFAEVETLENRAVLFNGLIPHAASHPVNNNRRIAVNINFTA